MKNFTDIQLRILEKTELDCIDVTRLLGDYTDRDLGISLRGRLDAHFRQCTQCREMAASYKQVVDLAHELGQRTASVDNGVQNRLRAALNKKLGLELPISE